MRKEVVFTMVNPQYRVVCVYGDNSFTKGAWWGYLQKEVEKRRWLIGKKVKVWKEVDSCWWSFLITDKQHLEKNAINFYKTNIVDFTNADIFAEKIANT